MALLERVTTLLKANINDMIDKAEDPEKMIKQLILDMQNQLLQVKTQVAIAIADQHLLENKQKENEDKLAEWQRKAELAVNKKQDALARAALERSLSHKQMAESFAQQVADQRVEVDNLKNALRKLEQKLAEAQNRSELLVAQYRRSRAVSKAGDAQAKLSAANNSGGFDRMRAKVLRTEAIGKAKAELAGDDNLEDRFAQMEKEDEVERLLQELKNKRGMTA
jgi:phage shock protein A